jgi:hypothetical protein
MAIAEPVARKPRKSTPKRPDSESTFPIFRKPQLATLSRSVPTGTEITPDWLGGHPSFKGLREDKPATDVALEAAP